MCLTPPDLFDRFGPQKIRWVAQKILELHAEQATTLANGPMPGVSPTAICEQTVSKMDPPPTPVNDNDEPRGNMPEVIKPIMLPFRPANQQQASHVLIVDDNEINLKVSYSIFVPNRNSAFILPQHHALNMFSPLTISDYDGIHAKARLQLRHSVQWTHCIGEIFNL